LDSEPVEQLAKGRAASSAAAANADFLEIFLEIIESSFW
jgi:hypothetical protein